MHQIGSCTLERLLHKEMNLLLALREIVPTRLIVQAADAVTRVLERFSKALVAGQNRHLPDGRASSGVAPISLLAKCLTLGLRSSI